MISGRRSSSLVNIFYWLYQYLFIFFRWYRYEGVSCEFTQKHDQGSYNQSQTYHPGSVSPNYDLDFLSASDYFFVLNLPALCFLLHPSYSFTGSLSILLQEWEGLGLLFPCPTTAPNSSTPQTQHQGLTFNRKRMVLGGKGVPYVCIRKMERPGDRNSSRPAIRHADWRTIYSAHIRFILEGCCLLVSLFYPVHPCHLSKQFPFCSPSPPPIIWYLTRRLS